ncbi:MAG: uroporphyrinogen-III synthase [Rhizomicrobium sp.]
MRVLVTRPLEDARLTALELARLGHETVIAPLFAVRFIECPEPLADDAQAVLATSGNGVRALSRRTKHRGMPLFAVGPHTAAIARSAGFDKVIDAGGDSAALARAVRRRLRPADGPLLIFAGRHASPELKTAVQVAGFHVRVCTAYEAIAAPALPTAACEALGSDSLDAALLFSPRSAGMFAERVQQAGFADACMRLLACCISNSAALALDGLQFGHVRIAARPDHDHVLALLQPGLPSDDCRA